MLGVLQGSVQQEHAALYCLWREKWLPIASALLSMRCPMSVSRTCLAGPCAGARCAAGGGLG